MTKPYKSTFGIARGIAETISFFGWIGIVGCILGVLFVFYKSVSEHSNVPMILLALPPWVGGVIGSMVVIGIGQMIRAGVDTADNTGEMLDLLKQNQTSKQNSEKQETSTPESEQKRDNDTV